MLLSGSKVEKEERRVGEKAFGGRRKSLVLPRFFVRGKEGKEKSKKQKSKQKKGIGDEKKKFFCLPIRSSVSA